MKDWKTTLIGAVGAVAIAIYPLLSGGTFDWKNIGMAALVAIFGYFVGDKQPKQLNP